MRLGVCAPITDAELMASFGFEYLEVNASVIAEMTEEEFAAFCAENEKATIHAEAANILFPGSVRLTGETDFDSVKIYIEKVLSRLGKAGIKIAVFGSSGSRKVPEGFDMDAAWQQLVKVGKFLGETAQKYGVVIALEPLRKAETNIINLQSEGLKMVQEVNHPNFRLLTDLFHLTQEGGTAEDVKICGETLAHVHIAKPDDRKGMYPGDGIDYTAFFEALRAIGYTGRISFEGDAGSEREKALPLIFEVMKRA